MDKWRPRDWENPYQEELDVIPTQRGRARVGEDLVVYEAGGDAMLEALKDMGEKTPSLLLEDFVRTGGERLAVFLKRAKVEGWLVFIPGKE